LDEILLEVSRNTGVDLKDVPKLMADVSDSDSLRRMAKQGDVVLNCVGPYAWFGEVVVRACIEEGTHHLDLSGEADYLETMQLKYDRLAEEKGVYVIAPCGFDSIPADLGTTYLQQQFGGDLNSVELYMQFHTGGKPAKLNHGTWDSGILMASKIFLMRALDKQLHPDPLPKPKYGLAQRLLHYIDVGEQHSAKGWFFPNPMPDQRIVRRSQRYFYHKENKRPVQVNAYFGERNFFVSLFLIIGVAIMGLIAQFKLGQNLLIKYCEIFSLGMVSKKGPTQEEMDNHKFTFTLIGKGWSEKSDDGTGKETHSQPPNKTKVLLVKGRNPAYGATNEIFLNCALTVIQQKDKLPKKGGVYTPGVAFANTDLVDRLNKNKTKNGVSFTLV